MAKPTAIDLFCGCGGLTQGLRDAGFRVVGAVDLDRLAVLTYKANHRRVRVWHTDIRRLTVKSVMAELGIESGQLDLLAGCPPCQGFSTLRTLNGSRKIDDPRNNLLREFQRFANVLRPRAVMLENVPGLQSETSFDEFCDLMETWGYNGKSDVFNAADFNVPQRRRRLIYLGFFGHEIDFASPQIDRRTVRDAFRGLPKAGKSGDSVHDLGETRSLAVQARIAKIPKNGGGRMDLALDEQLPCHLRSDGFKDVYGRMAWDEQAPTITSGCFNPSKGRFLHPVENRAITMREAALLQGFPRGYKFPEVRSKSAIALLIGNALPPPFVAAHARKVASICRREAMK